MNKIQIEIDGGDTATPINLEKRLHLFKQYITSTTSRVIDCGCGKGEYVISLRKQHIETWGIEFNVQKVEAFKKANPGQNWVSQGNLEKIMHPDNCFDIAICNEVIEHVPDEKKVFGEIQRVLRVKGILIVLAPNRLFPFESHGVFPKHSPKKISPAIPFVPYIPIGIGKKLFRYWARNYWPWELKKIIRQNGFTIISSVFLWQTFENISGQQPIFLKLFLPFLRCVFNALEKIPGIRMFGITQGHVCVKI